MRWPWDNRTAGLGSGSCSDEQASGVSNERHAFLVIVEREGMLLDLG